MAESDQEQDFSRRFAHELNIGLRNVRRILKILNVDDQEKDVRGRYWPVRTLDDGKKRRSSPSHVCKLVRAYRNIEIALEEGKYSRALSLADDNNDRKGLPQSFLEKTAKTAFEGSLRDGIVRARGMYAQDDYYDAIAAAWGEFKVAQECLKKDYHPGGIDGRRSAAGGLVKALMGADLYAKMVGVLNMTVDENVRLFSEKEERGYKGEAATRLTDWIGEIGKVDSDDVAFVERSVQELGNGDYEKGLINLVITYANEVKEHKATGVRIAKLKSDYDQKNRLLFG